MIAALEHAVCRRVGDHQCAQRVGVGGRLLLEIGEIDVAVGVGRDDDHPHAGHHRAGSVRTVGRGRDQADVPRVVAVATVERTDGEQARELALRAGVRLQRHGVVAGHRAQPRLEVRDEARVPSALVGRRVRVDPAELGPRHGLHLRGRVQLHRARAQRDHRAVQREVTVGEAAQVPQHLRLGPVAVEHLLREVRLGTRQLGRDR